MAKINILDSSVFNRIAAGEVVDRPYSVVKEFVENSIDAGATEIIIEIEKGGKNLIRISDNGSGIEKDDFKSVFLPHATSKISCVEDLDLIETLGFRGEALASIASVANVTVKSCATNSDCGYEMNCCGGKLGDLLPCARDKGTEIVAENLFFNTPVRAKFLKSDKSEETEITNFVSRFILGNPDISFKYFVDGKLVLQSFGGGLEEALVSVYGAQTLSNCYEIKAVKHGITVRGYIGKPSFTKANRTYQSAFVNGRYVINNTVSSAISNAFSSYLMKRQYPFYVLFIDVPPEVIDVNVHPNKADVRFENNQVIYGSIYSVVSAVLDGNATALEYIVGVKNEGKNTVLNNFNSTMPDINNENSSFKTDNTDGEFKTRVEPSATIGVGGFETTTLTDSKNDKNNYDVYNDVKLKQPLTYDYNIKPAAVSPITLYDSKYEREENLSELEESCENKNAQPDLKTDVFQENKRLILASEQKAKQQKIIFENATYKGCLFNTYLIYELGDDCFLIDQHAAHERLLFDKFKIETESKSVIKQPMLVPYIINVNAQEGEFIENNLAALDDIGFECERFGNDCYKVSTVPLSLQDISISAFFAEVLKNVGTFKGIRLADLLKDKLAMTACKHAVKGGMALTDSEKSKLFDILGGDMGLKCPHGRPVAVKLTKIEIEKMFKRIV